MASHGNPVYRSEGFPLMGYFVPGRNGIGVWHKLLLPTSPPPGAPGAGRQLVSVHIVSVGGIPRHVQLPAVFNWIVLEDHHDGLEVWTVIN